MTRSRFFLSAACLALVAGALPSQAATPQEVLASKLRAVETIIDAQLAKEAVPGAAFAIVADQDTVWRHTYGVQDLQTRRSVTDDTAFSICSVSKLFTGISVMDLVEDGRIDLDAPLSRYLGDDAGEGADDVTVRNLLSHVSGLPRENADFWFNNAFPDDGTLRANVSMREDWYEPYDHWQYSNLGMAALGQVIEAASGRSFHDYVQAEILNPLGMENTTTDMPFDRVGQGFARGYYVRDGRGQRQPVAPHSFDAYASAAGVASSIDDMADFMAWHFRLRDADDAEILDPATLKTMQRVHWTGEDFDEPAWGLAYATRRLDGKTLWGHGGYCPGTVTEFMMRNPDRIGVIAMATANDVSAGGLARMIYAMTSEDVKAVHGEDAQDAASDESRDLTDYEGHYSRPNYDWDVYIGLAGDGLFRVPLHDDEPQDEMETFEPVEGDLFRRQREDGSDGEPLRFVRDDAGRVIEVVSGGYRLRRE
ncbi:serine hydrolase [uncultured Algimonas sp.]|uniref:serine hydrolase n=1 Tax=uncultured Algimonas sp. TaxID=1547920 RepID=UPI002628D494|nr:serine hydrolase [uncultured Algimonas sp.]